MKKLTTVLLTSFSLFSINTYSAEYSAYKWIDSSGKTNYSDIASYTDEVKRVSVQDNIVSSSKDVPVYDSGMGGSGNIRVTNHVSALNDRYTTRNDDSNIFKNNDTGNSRAVKSSRIPRYTSNK